MTKDLRKGEVSKFCARIWRVASGTVVAFLISGSASAATYYVRADGIASTKASSTGCSSASKAMNIPVFKNEHYSAGDRVVLCHEGGVYREAVLVPASGLPGNPITYDGRGTAVFSGSDIVSGWASSGGNVYTAYFHTQPQLRSS